MQAHCCTREEILGRAFLRNQRIHGIPLGDSSAFCAKDISLQVTCHSNDLHTTDREAVELHGTEVRRT